MPMKKEELALAAPFLELFEEGTMAFASDRKTKPETVATLGGLCLRESIASWALRPKGSPTGTGDWSARAGSWPHREGVQVIADTPSERLRLEKSGWSLPMRKNPISGVWEVATGPYAIPLDGLGWGRGLLQLDVLGDFKDLYPGAGKDWPVDRQAFAACAMLDKARRELAPYAGSPLFGRAVLSRYNCALNGVIDGMRWGNPDLHTTGGDYGKDVESLRDGLLALYPERLRIEPAAS